MPWVTFQLGSSKVQELPVMLGSDRTRIFSKNQNIYQPISQLNFNKTVFYALKHSPDV